MTQTYESFIAKKRETTPPTGFTVDRDYLHTSLFEFQRDIVRWALRRGRAAVFAMTGLGKTRMQVEWARVVAEDGPALIVAPLAVCDQTVREAATSFA